MNLRLQRLLKLHGLYQEKANDGTGGSTSGGSGAGSEGEGGSAAGTEGGEGGEGEGSGGEGGEGTKKPSDAEAQILKDLMKQKGQNQTLKAKLDEAMSKLKQFEGLDVAKVREILDKAQQDEEAQALARGDFERLKTAMADRHAAELATVNESNKQLQGQIGQLQAQIANMTVGGAFKGSAFLKELNMTSRTAQAAFGGHFEYVDGQVVGYDKPKGSEGRTPLVDAAGSPLPFDLALKKLVDSDPEADNLYRPKSRAGSGSGTVAGKGAPTTERELTSIQKIAAGLRTLKLNQQS